ncbi:MAG TPA: N-acyl homoserine lactonase family protein [Ramlibacter sp.]|nr:N-acyl homoserine lactonase family protein [Ramlibacter sp.]
MSNSSPVPYELFALRYATRHGTRSEFFLGDPHDDAPMGLDYYVWLARRPGHVCLIDTGFNESAARRRNRELLRNPIDALELLGTSSTEVQDVVLTHFHYDHAGNFDRLPAARFHVQESEMQFATGRHMAHKAFNAAYDVTDVTALVEHVFQGRVQFHDGDASLSDGITLHHVGGHTMGLQFARVFTRRGWVLVASDASHFYEGYLCCRPMSLVFHLGDMIRGFERLRAMAETDDHVIPGHDPHVMQRYAAPSPALEGIAVRLDEAPRQPPPPPSNERR